MCVFGQPLRRPSCEKGVGVGLFAKPSVLSKVLTPSVRVGISFQSLHSNVLQARSVSRVKMFTGLKEGSAKEVQGSTSWARFRFYDFGFLAAGQVITACSVTANTLFSKVEESPNTGIRGIVAEIPMVTQQM